MNGIELWLTPLLLLPGVALVIVSTSARYQRLHEELHHLFDDTGEPDEDLSREALRLNVRAGYFCSALVSLYVASALLSLAALVGGLTRTWAGLSYWSLVVLFCAAIATVLYALIQLIREARQSLAILQYHTDSIERRHRSR